MPVAARVREQTGRAVGRTENPTGKLIRMPRKVTLRMAYGKQLFPVHVMCAGLLIDSRRSKRLCALGITASTSRTAWKMNHSAARAASPTRSTPRAWVNKSWC